MRANEPTWSWDIIHVDPNTIKFPERQITKASRAKIEQFKRKIRTLGFFQPALIDREGVAVTGTARILAARELGLATIPALRHDQLTPSHIRAIRIGDNHGIMESAIDFDLLAREVAELGLTGFDGLDLGFETAELDQLYARLTGDVQGDDIGELDLEKPAVTRLGDVWQMGDHRIICGDCRDNAVIDTLMGGRIAAASFLDAPFNVSINGHVGGRGKVKHAEFAMASGEMSDNEFQAFNAAYLAQASRVLRPGAVIFACMDAKHSHTLTLAAMSQQLTHLTTCVWVKSNAGLGGIYRNQHEFVLVFRKAGGKTTNNVELGKHGRSRTTVWSYAGANSFGATRSDDLAAHPTVKPTPLVEDAIKDVTNRGDVVIDLFGGSGTTMLAAERCGRRAMLCEIAPNYVDTTLRRFETMFRVPAVHEATGLTFEELAANRSDGAKQPVRRPRMRERSTSRADAT